MLSLAVLALVLGLPTTPARADVNVPEARPSDWWLDDRPHARIDEFYPGQVVGYWGRVTVTAGSSFFTRWTVTGPCNFSWSDQSGVWVFNQGGDVWLASGDPTVIPWDACPGTYTFHFKAFDNAVPGGTNEATTTFVVKSGAPPGGVPAGQTYGVNPDTGRTYAANPSGTRSDPVNTATGAFLRSETDASLPGIGIPFALTRSYTSADTTTGPLGPGWTHAYNVTLSFDGSGNATLRTGTGQRIGFTLQGDGSFLGAPGTRVTLRSVTGGYEVVHHDQAKDSFDSAGKLTSSVDRHGQGLAFAYDATTGRLATASGSGRTVSFSHDPATGLLSSVSLPGSRSVSYGYTSGRLTSVTDLRGGTIGYSYDAGGRLSQVTDQRGETVVRNTYDPTNGRVTDQYDGRNNHSSFGWNPTTQTATMTDARNNTWTDVYSDNVLVKRVDPLGNAIDYAWDENINLRSVTDPRRNTVSMAYDSRGNMTQRWSPAPFGYEETFFYNATNDLTGYKNGRYKTTAFNVDNDGYLTQISHPQGIITRFGYDRTRGLVTSVTDARSKVTTYDYDTQGNRTKITSPLNEITTFGYDTSGRLTSRVSPKGNVVGGVPADYTTTFTYDAADHLRTVTDPLGNVVEHTYNPAGDRASTIDPNNRTTTFGYDADAHLTTVTAPGSVTTTYDYDATGNLWHRVDAKNHTTTFGYDAANRLTSVASPLRTLAYGYDAAGNRTTFTNARNVVETTTYDELNRTKQIAYSDTTPGVTFSYDATSNRTSMTDAAGATTYTYDDLDRLTRASQPNGIFDYTYDGLNNLLTRKYPDNTTFTYTYDDDGRMATVANGATTMATFGYDVNSNPTTTAYQVTNGHTETRVFDRADRMTEVKTANVAGNFVRSAATLDAAGNPLQVVDETGATTTHEYDTRSRLAKVCFAAATCTGATDFISYTYDAVGNRLTETRPTSSASSTYTYDAADKLTSSVTGNKTTNYTYDADGNQLTGGGTFTYDGASRLKTAKIGNVTTTYSYDGDGLRLEGSTGNPASAKTRYLWDKNVASGLPALALERDGNDATRRLYTYGITPTPLSETIMGLPYYYHQDRLGSVRGVTSNTGVGQWKYAYEPFGKSKVTTKLVNSAPANPIQFTGSYADSGGFYNLRARELDTNTGRFLQSDPVMASIDDPYVAGYVYAHNRPGVLTDLPGTEDDDCFLCLNTLKTVAVVAGGTALVAGAVLAAPVEIPAAGAIAVISTASAYVSIGAAAGYAAGTCYQEGLSGSCAMAGAETVVGGATQIGGRVAGRLVGEALIVGANGDDVMVLRRSGEKLTETIIGSFGGAALALTDRRMEGHSRK